MKCSNAGTYKKILLTAILACTVLALLLPVVLKRYLATPQAASRVSRLLSDRLGQPVVIKNLAFSDGALRMKGLSIANPSGFPQSNLLSVDALTLKPRWFTLLSGERVLEKIAAEGLSVNMQHDKAGVWNFSQLQRRLTSSPPSAAELVIRQLAITRGTLQVNDQTIAGLNFKMSNLATKGSQKSGFNLEFEDPGRNHYVLSGKARLSKEPELEVALSSSSIALNSLSKILKIDSRYLPDRGDAILRLSATLSKGNIRSSGELSINSAVVPGVARGESFSGILALSADYDLRQDHLAIEHLTLHLNKLLAVRASGDVKELKHARRFTIDIVTDEIDLARIAPLISGFDQRNITLGGKLGKSSLHLSGNAVDGISSAKGNLKLSHGVLIQDKRLLFNDLSVTAALSGSGDKLTISGNAVQTKTSGEPVLETLDAPYSVTFDRHLKTVTARSPALSARARGVSFSGRLSYADGTALVENAALTSKDLTMALGRLSARIPAKQVASATVRYPVSADFSGCDLRRGEALLKNASGTIRGAYAYNPSAKWLTGTAELHADKLAWQGKEAGTSRVHAEFSESGAKAAFKTALLGGTVQGDAAFNPFAWRNKVAFNINAQGINLSGVNKYAGLRGDTTLSGGTLDAACTGRYSSSGGLFCHIGAEGKDIAVTGKAGKRILSAGGIKLDSDLSGKKLVINEALLTAGKAVAVRANGAIENVFLPERQGRIAVTVPRTSLADVVDTFLNSMPRAMQEATFEGSLAAEGGLNLLEGKILADGAVTLSGIGVDAPTDKISVTAINGVLPLSLDLAGKAVVKPPSTTSFSRRNYATLVKQLRQSTEKADTITIGSGSFGGIRVDSAKIRLRAARGVTEIISLDSSLFGGALMGKGFIAVQNGIFYRGDLLLNDLSLVRICQAFPAISGYLSGKIDGIVSVLGRGSQLSGITGFTEFWARETSAEKMLVSKAFLQRLSGKKLSGFFFSSDRSYDHAGIKAVLEKGFLTFDSLDISHTNLFGVRDLSVTIAPSQNRIALEHLLGSIKEATVRGKGATGTTGKETPAEAPPAAEFKWDE